MLTGSWCSGMGVGGWVLMIGLWVALLGVIVWAVTQLFPSAPRNDALDLLDRRLAVGDIDPGAYREARSELSGAGRTLNRG